jgi:hypothetical protein
LLVILQTNLPPLTEQQQDFTSLPVSEQIIFVPKAGSAKSAVAATAKNALFIYRGYWKASHSSMPRSTQDCGDQLLFSERFVCENREIRVPVEPLHNHIGLFCLSAHLICA